MTTAAVMVVRDEADVIEATVRHLLWHVDEVIVADHRSTDRTRKILKRLPVLLRDVLERGFHGDRIWTWLALEAAARGHEWVVVSDADDVWYVTADPHKRRIADFLAEVPADARAVSGFSTNHVPTALDDASEPNPFVRIGWRQVNADARKVAFRVADDLVYACHNAWYGGVVEEPSSGLAVRHFTIRTADQLVRKVRNGLDSSSVAAGMPEGFDADWQQWKCLDDASIRSQFRERFWSAYPRSDGLVYDPAPLKVG